MNSFVKDCIKAFLLGCLLTIIYLIGSCFMHKEAEPIIQEHHMDVQALVDYYAKNTK